MLNPEVSISTGLETVLGRDGQTELSQLIHAIAS